MRMRLIVLPLLALAVGIYFWVTAPNHDRPACTWRIGLGTEIRQGQNYDELAPESPVRLSVVCQQSRYLYVFSSNAEDGTLLLFPSPDVEADCDNPLPEGRTVLPGKREDQEVAWNTRHGITAISTYFAVASNEPVAEIEALLPRLRRWTNTVFPDHSMAVTHPAKGIELLGKPHEPIPSTLLKVAADIGNTDPNPNGPMKPATGYPGIFTSSWKIRERKEPAKPAGESGDTGK